MRASEVRNLRWEHIDLISKSITVSTSKTDVGERKIPLNTAAYLAVMELRERSKRLFGEAIQPNWYLFPLGADVEPRKPRSAGSDQAAAKQKSDPLRPVGSWRRCVENVDQVGRVSRMPAFADAREKVLGSELPGDISKLKSVTAGFRFHDLRHQAITELSEGGASDATIMGIAGHVSRKMLSTTVM